MAQSIYGRTNTVLELDDSAIGPEGVSNFLPRDQVPGAFQQHGEDSEGLLGESDWLVALAAQLSGAKVKFEPLETGYSVGTLNLSQKSPQDFEILPCRKILHARIGAAIAARFLEYVQP